MTKEEKYKFLNYAREEYSNIFNCNYIFKKMTKKELCELLKQNKHSTMCRWDYCCNGLYSNCWQEPFEVGCWQDTQKEVDDIIKNIIISTKKFYKKENRILYYEDKNGVHIIIIVRDILESDYLITFTNKNN